MSLIDKMVTTPQIVAPPASAPTPEKKMVQGLKLSVFSGNFSTEEVLVHAEDFPNLKEGDTLEIFDPEDTINPRLLLQVSQSFVQHAEIPPSREASQLVVLDLKRWE